MAKRPSILGRFVRGIARAVDATLETLGLAADKPSPPRAESRAEQPSPSPAPKKRTRKSAEQLRKEYAEERGPIPEPPPKAPEAEIRHNVSFRWRGDRQYLDEMGVSDPILDAVESVLEEAGWDGRRISTMLIHYKPAYVIDATGKHVPSDNAAQKTVPKVNFPIEKQLNTLVYWASKDDVEELVAVDLILGVATHGRAKRPEGEPPKPKKKRKKLTPLGPTSKENRKTVLARERKRRQRATPEEKAKEIARKAKKAEQAKARRLLKKRSI